MAGDGLGLEAGEANKEASSSWFIDGKLRVM